MNENSHRARGERHHVPVGTVIADVDVLERQIDQEHIARRAYEIYEARDRADGHADTDWFQAESECAARRETQPLVIDRYGASRSFADRIRSARTPRAATTVL